MKVGLAAFERANVSLVSAAVVGGEDDQRLFPDAQLVQLGDELADLRVHVRDHRAEAVLVFRDAGITVAAPMRLRRRLVGCVRHQMPDIEEERTALLMKLLHQPHGLVANDVGEMRAVVRIVGRDSFVVAHQTGAAVAIEPAFAAEFAPQRLFLNLAEVMIEAVFVRSGNRRGPVDECFWCRPPKCHLPTCAVA